MVVWNEEEKSLTNWQNLAFFKTWTVLDSAELYWTLVDFDALDSSRFFKTIASVSQSSLCKEIPMRFLTVEEVCGLLSITRPTLLKLVEIGKLPMVDISAGSKNKRWVIREDHLLEAMTAPSMLQMKTAPKANRRRIDLNVPKVF
jgi:excisionase family DNA binding protein